MKISLDTLPYDPKHMFETNRVREISQSAVTMFMACPQKFVMRYMMKLNPRALSVPLTTGSAVHEAFDVMLDPTSDKSEVERMLEGLEKAHAVFDKAMEQSDLIALGEESDMEKGRAQTEALVREWFNWNSDFLKEYRLLSTEETVRADFSTDSIDSRMCGKIDGIAMDENGDTWIMEHKTRKSLSDLDLFGLELDTQALFYIVMFDLVLADANIPTPKGFIYNAMMKPQNRFKKGNPDLQELTTRMQQYISNDPDKYFLIRPIPVSDASRERARKDIERVIQAIDGIAQGRVYRNTNSCNDYGGCPYRSLCSQRADVNEPETIFSLPTIDRFEIKGIHEELKNDTVGKYRDNQ